VGCKLGIKDRPYGTGVSFRDLDGVALEFFAPFGSSGFALGDGSWRLRLVVTQPDRLHHHVRF